LVPVGLTTSDGMTYPCPGNSTNPTINWVAEQIACQLTTNGGNVRTGGLILCPA
jgi:hypothetical protein